MDFGTLLHVAKKNSEMNKSSESKYYSTKFTAPKKEAKEKKLSENIKKFLAKKEQEEREKARIEREKRDRLLAMRDEKQKNKIKRMLKVIKSANKSVLEDAIDNENTAITLQGPDQPDEDDYGYVSQEAAALYQKYMEKVKAIPEENKFAPSRPTAKSDLNGTKDRVRAALLKEQEERNNPKGSKLVKQSQTAPTSLTTANTYVNSSIANSQRKKELYDPQTEKELEEKKRKEEEQKRAKQKKPPPPPFDFKELLKLAEKKQHEPVEIVVEPKKEPERLLTKKEKKELEERKAYLEAKEKRRKEAQSSSAVQSNAKALKTSGQLDSTIVSDKKNSQVDSKIPKMSSKIVVSSTSTSVGNLPNLKEGPKKISGYDHRLPQKPPNNIKLKNAATESKSSNTNSISKPQGTNTTNNISKNSNSMGLKSSKIAIAKPLTSVAKPSGALQSQQLKQTSNGRQFLPKDAPEARKGPLQTQKDAKCRQFPPADIERCRPVSSQCQRRDVRHPKKPLKRRIVDDDEYDSELDDFIDDGPDDQDYSNYIKEIFGYDKSKYRDIDDDAAMESTFAQQMREEYVSKKIGLLEDLEDMRLEAEEKKKKALIKKRKLK